MKKATKKTDCTITAETVIGKVEGGNLKLEITLVPGETQKGKPKWFSQAGGPVRFLSALVVDGKGKKIPVWLTPIHVIPATKKDDTEE